MRGHRLGGATRRWVVTIASGLCVVLAACGEGTSSSDPSGSGATTGAAGKATGAVPADAGAAKFEGAEPGSGEGVRIGYVSNGEKISFVKIVSDGIREQAKKAGAKLLFCDSEVDAAKALACARNFRTQQVDVLIEYQNDAKAAPEICSAGPQVPVIAVSIKQEPCEVAFMGADNARAGEIAGKGLGEYAKREWDCDYDAVVLLEAKKTGEINEQRVRGALRAFEGVCGKAKNLKLVDGDGTIDQYQTRFADVLTALPGQHRIVLLTINDDAALGALAAAGSQGRTKDVFVVAQGADPTSHCEIATNPQWIGDSAYFPERYGEIIVPNAIRAAKGEKIPESLLVPHVFVTKENVAEYYDVAGC
jgi:ribose transport system substrate-binding protein